MRTDRFWTYVLAGTLAVAVLATAASGCRREEEPLVLTAPWGDGEMSRFEVVNSDTGASLVDWVISIAAASDGGWVITLETSAQATREFSSVHVAAGTLLPLSIEYSLESPQVNATYTGIYQEEDLVISATVNGETQNPTVKLPGPPYFENEQFVATLRALPLAEGWERSLNIIVSRTASKASLPVKVAAREQVTVPSGTFDCWKVELAGTGQAAWINVEAPHQLVRYENVPAKTVSELVEYQPGQ